MDPRELDLLLAADTYVQKHFPNPSRVGCPGTEVLQEVAGDLGNARSLAVIQHAARCAPCLNQLREFIRHARRR